MKLKSTAGLFNIESSDWFTKSNWYGQKTSNDGC